MKALQRPGRVAAVIGAVAAVSAGTLLAVGTASAAEPAKCVDNVNVREQPRIDSRVVALCESGTTVEAGEIRNGFVRLNDLGGWSSQEFISINGQQPVKPGTGSGSGTGAGPSTSDDPEGTGTAPGGGTADGGTAPRSGRSGGTEPRSGDRSEGRTNGAPDEEAPAEEPAPAPAPGGGGLPLPLPGA